jgi:hypothetical protein
MRRLLALLLIAALLGGCASVTGIDSEVTAYSQWPADRKPGSYVFERLPSQQAEPARQQQLEDWARPAIAAAGFVAAPSRPEADVTIQLGARVTAAEPSPFVAPYAWGPWGYGWRDPWWGSGWYGWRYGWGYGWGPGFERLGYEREVALLIRDRRSGEPLYQANARSTGYSPQLELTMPAMFAAALHDFPHGDAKAHVVSVEPPAAAASR